jgi:hypothetical protein|tara:strand:- start:736 stop:924 length:189 start_codon:yes stop_codon:yes gene_type:complete
MLSQGAKICLHIDYEMHLEEGMEHPAIVRKLVKEWKLTPNEVEDIIKEQEEFLTTWGKGEIV